MTYAELKQEAERTGNPAAVYAEYRRKPVSVPPRVKDAGFNYVVFVNGAPELVPATFEEGN